MRSSAPERTLPEKKGGGDFLCRVVRICALCQALVFSSQRMSDLGNRLSYMESSGYGAYSRSVIALISAALERSSAGASSQ